MIEDKSKFVNINFKQEGHVTYGDNNKGLDFPCFYFLLLNFFLSV